MVASKTPKIPKKWLELFELIPGYDPVLTAGDCWFDVPAAEHAIEFFHKILKHAKSTETVPAGSPFILEPWEQAVLGCLFGWKRQDGLRRFKEALLFLPKKTGKTALAAGMLLLVHATDHEFGAEQYSGAASRNQAAKVFSHVIGMIKQNDDLTERFTIYGGKGGTQQRSVYYEDEMSSYQCLAADADVADGGHVHFAVCDEIHRWKSPELGEILQKSTAAGINAMVVYLTTADYNRPSFCNNILKYAKAVRDNPGDAGHPGYDSAFLPVIYEADESEDWTDPAVWRRVNPNIGVTVPEEFFRRECQKAAESPTTLTNFKRLHLNMVTATNVAFFIPEQWDACDGSVDPKDLEGHDCFAGIDLASNKDITAFVLYFPHNRGVLPFFFVPEANAPQREKVDRVPYVTWGRQGYIHLMHGNVTDYDGIRKAVQDAGEKYNIREIAIDRWDSTQLQTQLAGDGFTITKFGQGFGSMNAPCKMLERLVITGQLRHGGNPVLTWMSRNVVATTNETKFVKFTKDKATEKIDGIIGLVMALGRSMEYVVADSVYETRGVFRIER